MPATSHQALTFSDVLSTTLNEHRADITDNTYRSSAVLNAITKGGIKKTLEGGARIIEPGLFTAPTGFSSYAGTDTISTNINQKFDAPQYEWAQVGGTIGITGTDQIQNSGRHGIIKLVKASIKAGEKELKDRLNTMLLSDGSGNAGKDVHGLRLLVSTAAQTVGGLTETTYTRWVPQRGGNVGAFGTSLTDTTGGYGTMNTLWSLCSDGSEHPDVLIGAREIQLSYQLAIGVNVRYTVDLGNANSSTNKLWAGWNVVYFNGVPFVVDRETTELGTYDSDNAFLYMLNSDYMTFYVHKDRNFITEPFQKPINQDVMYAKLLVACQLTVSNRRMHGVMQVSAV